MMWVPQGPILPVEVRMIAINIYRKYGGVHKEKRRTPDWSEWSLRISCEMMIKGEAKNNLEN